MAEWSTDVRRGSRRDTSMPRHLQAQNPAFA